MMVLDASIVLASLFEDERTPAVVAVMENVGSSGAFVTSQMPLEVANGLRIAIRRKRISPSFRDAGLVQLARLPIEIDPETNDHAWHATLQLADRRGLTPYDAAYLELAQRRRVPLATLDRDLANAAEAEGVAVQGR
jgi:predicted nucleic acid-binding protein